MHFHNLTTADLTTCLEKMIDLLQERALALQKHASARREVVDINKVIILYMGE